MVRNKIMSILIEKMQAEHIPALADIEKVCFSSPWSEQGLKAELSNNYALFFVCIIDGVIAGYIGSHNILGEIYITNVAVSPAYRHKGIGKSLVEHLVNEGVESKAEFITLEVRKSNFNAISLYEGCGFSIVGERRDFYDNPKEDALLMTKYFNFEE